MNRQEARQWIMKIAYEMDFESEFDEDKIIIKLGNHSIEKDSFIISSLQSLILNLDFIDEKIKTHLEGWSLNRIAKVDLAILRVAINEMFFDETIPISVSINEAIELAKIYSDELSYRYINGVLGNISKLSDLSDRKKS